MIMNNFKVRNMIKSKRIYGFSDIEECKGNHSCHMNATCTNKSKLLFFHLKGGRCSFWGFLYCDDRRSPWWASRDELQHNHIRADTVMISMNFNNYVSLVIFFIISVLFCFVFEHWTLYTIRVLAVFDFYYRT